MALYLAASAIALSAYAPLMPCRVAAPAVALRSSRPAVMGFLDELKEMSKEQTAADADSPFAQRQAREEEKAAALRKSLEVPKFSSLEDEKADIMENMETQGLQWATDNNAFARMAEIDVEIKARDEAK